MIFCRHAHYSLGDFKQAADAFRRGVDIDPSNSSLKTGLANAEARIVPDDTTDEMPPLESPATARGAGAGAGAGGLPDMGGMADMLRNMGGGGGGMPDLASMLNNPGMMQMAQQMMANGGLERMMQNPALANMVRDVGGNGCSSGTKSPSR